MRKDVRELVDQAAAQGWRVDERESAILLFSPDGETIVTVHYTPSARQWRDRAMRHLREGGFEE